MLNLRSLVFPRNPLINTYAFYSSITVRTPVFLHSGNVRDNQGANKKKKKVGRGERSGKGKTSGRGQKGWHARAAKSRPVPGFEGGQSGIIKAIPQMGQVQNRLNKFTHVALDSMQFWIDRKKLDPTKKITVKELFDAKCIKQVKKGIYLNCKGSQFFNTKIDIEVAEATPEAIEKVEALGGSIKAVFHSPRDLRAIMHPELFAELPTEAQLPSEWTDLKVYLDPFKRGYLAPKEDEKLSDVVKRVMTESSKVPLFKK